MSENCKIFGEEKIGKLLLKFSIPIIISFLVSELYNMVDTLFIGRTIGGSGIGALVLVFPLQRIIIALSLMIAIGTATALSRANGQKDAKKAKKVIQNGFTLSYAMMIVITIVIFIFREKILLSLGASDFTLDYAKTYLSIIIYSSAFLSLTMFISNIMVSLGNNKIAIISTSIGAVINIALDYILVVHLKMGVQGAAIATVTSQVIGFVYAYMVFLKLKKKNDLNLNFELDYKILMPIILVGISTFIIEAEDGILIAVLNNLLQNVVGDNGIIVLGIISKVYMFLFITMFGIASAMQPIAAYNMGAKNYKRLKKVMKKTTKYAFLTSTIMWVLAITFAPQLIGIFVKDKEIIVESIMAFRIMISAFPVISIYYVSIFYFQAMGKAKTSILVAVFRQVVIMIPLSILLVKGFHLGAMGVWLSYPISDILASIGSYILIKNEGIELSIKVRKQIEKERLA